MEYLPFGETLVEEHLNSNNSPYKFNAKEFDAETGNYYYGARYYSPKYNLMLSVDPAFEMYPGISPFAYTLQNPVRYVDSTGMFVEDYDDDYGIDNKGNITLIRETKDNFDRLYNSDDVMVGQVNKGYLSDGINIEEDGLFLDVKNKEDFPLSEVCNFGLLQVILKRSKLHWHPDNGSGPDASSKFYLKANIHYLSYFKCLFYDSRV